MQWFELKMCLLIAFVVVAIGVVDCRIGLTAKSLMAVLTVRTK